MNQELKRYSKGIFIPKDILFNKEIGCTEKVLISLIIYLDEENGCKASDEELAIWLNCSKKTIQRTLRILRDLNLIETVSFDGRTRVMRGLK